MACETMHRAALCALITLAASCCAAAQQLRTVQGTYARSLLPDGGILLTPDEFSTDPTLACSSKEVLSGTLDALLLPATPSFTLVAAVDSISTGGTLLAAAGLTVKLQSGECGTRFADPLAVAQSLCYIVAYVMSNDPIASMLHGAAKL